ncbi:Hypothetical predicted protein [Paramuricea clavata]|uniref:Peroxiredoxin-like 2A n=1 Tax=Paramuricea clavata TaxID=317549 RepID=A0A6S7HVD4_PARCT|nr:Hypothetical predicted protein [Paramuricea clavata]
MRNGKTVAASMKQTIAIVTRKFFSFSRRILAVLIVTSLILVLFGVPFFVFLLKYMMQCKQTVLASAVSLCREEASVLSSLKAELDQRGIPLIGVVHETIGVEEFKPFFKGDIYLDDQSGGFHGNMDGEGRLMGGLFVVGAADQGVLLEYREKVWGDHADIEVVRAAVENIKISHNVSD